jgi:ABC-type sugar transport system substrate-binding protein
MAFTDSAWWWCESHDIGVEFAAGTYQSEIQLDRTRQLIAKGVDGLIIQSASVEGLVPIVSEAKEKGIPVITANGDINSPDVLMYVQADSRKFGLEIGKQIENFLMDKYGEVRGTVFEVTGELASSIGARRHEGAMEYITQNFPNVEYDYVEGTWHKDTAIELTTAYLGSKTPDVVWGANGPTMAGIMEGLDKLGLKYPKDDQRHIGFFGCDLDPIIRTYIKEGYIDGVVDQPTQYYMTIAAVYMKKVLDEGEGALPDYGETVTAEDLADAIESVGFPAEGFRHLTGYPFDKHYWSPGVVEELNGHRFLNLDYAWVTTANVDDPGYWAFVVSED